MTPRENVNAGGVMGVHVTFAILALGLVYVAGRLDFNAIDLVDLSMVHFGQTLATFLFVALLIERATELILSWRFGEQEIAILTPLKEAADRNSAEVTLLARDMDMLYSPQDRMALMDDGFARNVTEARQRLPDQVAEVRRKLSRLSAVKKEWAIATGVLIALALSLSGLRLLHGAFGTQIDLSNMQSTQSIVFSVVDVVVTSIVLAGTADGVHRVIRRMTALGEKPTGGIVPG